MATIFVEGFDQYGATSINTPNLVNTSLPQGGWTPYSSPALNIVPSLNGQAGYAIQCEENFAGDISGLAKTLPNNYTRLIGGFRMLTPAQLAGPAGVMLFDNTTCQCSIAVQPISGRLGFCLGSIEGTLLDTSLSSLAGNTEHYIEFDITFGVGNAGGWTVWLDGVQAMQGVGTTVVSANSYANVVMLATALQFTTAAFDDVYIFDDTTTFNNAVLLSNPVVLTDVPIAASQTQFANDGNAIGNTNSTLSGSASISANSLILTPVTPAVACNAASVAIQLNSGNDPTAQFRAVIYADNAGAPGALLASGNDSIGFTSNELLILPLATQPALVAGTQYWIGFINDTAINVQYASVLGNPYRYVANTFASGPPATAPAMTSGTTPLFMYGLCTGSAENWNSVSLLPPLGDTSSVSTATAGDTDLYTYPALPNNVTAVYTVSVSGNCHLDQSGNRRFDMTAKSGTAIGNGLNTNIAPTVTYAWYDSPFDTDPNTGVAWTKTAAESAAYGMTLVS